MPKLLLINCDSNWGSTGRITEQIGQLAKLHGWDVAVAYGRESNPSSLTTLYVGSKFDVYEHYFEHKLFDNDGQASRKATFSFLQQLAKFNPDLIHLHNIHDHWLNYKILFKYLAALQIPIVWTQHDCWSFTGGCGHYTVNKCCQWETECHRCSFKRGFLPLIEQTEKHFKTKKELFNNIDNLVLVPVSNWLGGEIQKSFLKGKRIHRIYNGVDIGVFHTEASSIKKKYGIESKKLLIALATAWSEHKGLNDYKELVPILPDDVCLMLVGLNKKQIVDIPTSIIGIERTQDISELVELYSAADIVLNLSYEETFGLTTVEGFACGTPGIVYNSTASPELITPDTGLVVGPGDIKGVAEAVNKILRNGKDYYTKACRERAVKFFNKDDRFADYIKLYEELLNETKSK